MRQTICWTITVAMAGLLIVGTGCSINNGDDAGVNEVMGNSSGESFAENFDVDPAEPSFELSDDKWRERLTDDEYHVLRDHGTERAFSGDLLGNQRRGTYTCAGCGHELFSSNTRFDSGTGWPSFWAPLSEEGAVGTRLDHSLHQTRVEVHCGRCAGHLGHVFPDGPDHETGLRYCMNSVAMNFVESP